MRRRPYWLAVTAALTVAVATRTLPLWQSPLPFNPDGIWATRRAAATLAAGHLPLARMATDNLLFTPLLATVGGVLGIAPMRLGQPLSAWVGAVPGVLAVAVARRVAVRRGWAPRRAFGAATLAGLLLAVEGLYLHRSMPTDEQTVGLYFVPLAVVAVARAHATGRRAWWLAAAPLLAAIAPLHNLDGMVLGLALTIAAALTVAVGRWRRAAPLAALAAGFWGYFGAYHVLVERFTPATIVQEARLTDVPGLVVAWLILVAAGAAWFRRARPRTQRRIAGGAFGFGFVMVAVNAVVTVFPGTPSTPPLLLAGLLPLALPVALAIHAAPWVTRTRPEGLALSALLATPFVLVGVAFTAGLSPEYLATTYRVSTFAHFPVLVLAALGTVTAGSRLAAGIGARSRPRPRLATAVRVGLAAAVVVASAASIPIALGGLSVLNYKGVTEPAELGASRFGSMHANGTWVGDNHLVRIDPRGGANGTEAPAYAWLRGGSPPPACFVVLQRSWTTTGAQFFPAPPERLSRRAYRSFLRTRSVVYRSGAGDPITGVAPVDGGC